MKFTSYMFAFYDEHPRINPDGSEVKSVAEGEVWYRLVDNEGNNHYFVQQFRKGEIIAGKDDRNNIWSWDGDRENPTIRPSFLVRDYHFHVYVTKGKIDVLPDSAIENVAERLTWLEFFGEE